MIDPGKTYSKINGNKLSSFLSGTSTTNDFFMKTLYIPKIHCSPTLFPILYLRFTIKASSISTILFTPPNFIGFSSKYKNQTSLQKDDQFTMVSSREIPTFLFNILRLTYLFTKKYTTIIFLRFQGGV